MADGFSDPNLFAEFDRTPEKTDTILLSKLNETNNTNTNSSLQITLQKQPVSFSLDEDDDSDFQENGENSNIGDIIAESDSHKNNSNGAESADEVSKIKNELKKLRQRYETLQRQARIIHTSKCGKTDEGPAFQVVFMNNAIAQKHRLTVENFLSGLIMHGVKRTGNKPESNITAAAVSLAEPCEDLITPEDKIWQLQNSTAIGCSQIFGEFILDYMGWPLISFNLAASEGWERPDYQQFFSVALPEEEEDENACPQKIQRPKASCFNCDGAHTMKDCPVPFNQAKVNENRQKFRKNNPQTSSSNRYHLDDPRFSSFKPGIISPELRSAMGITDEQLPVYIYNMRQLGYPPGHLQAMMEETSGLAMFDKHGREVSLDGSSAEDGEVDSANPAPNKIDESKIVEFPGFNVSFSRDVRDEHRQFNRPAFSARQSKSNMARTLNEQKRGTKRLSMESHYDKGNKRSRRDETSCDMDISGSPKSGRRKSGKEDVDETLEDLQRQKELIQEQLALAEGEDADVQLLDSYEGDSKDNFIPPLPPTPVRPPLPQETPPVTPTSTANKTNNDMFKTPENPRILETPSSGGSLSMQLGTPVSGNAANPPKNKGLPTPDKFSDGIQQDIPFENLPGSTGTYERMRKLLNHLRQKESDK